MNIQILEPNIVINHPNSSQIEEMKSLWKLTFGDSDFYINLVFNNYVESRYCLCATFENKLIASLIGIPYKFVLESRGFSGLYLCGLATLKEFRGGGIMKKMLDMVSEILRDEKLDFSFLIPADNRLRAYYGRLNYIDSSELLSLKLYDTIVGSKEYSEIFNVMDIPSETHAYGYSDKQIKVYAYIDISSWNTEQWDRLCTELCNNEMSQNGLHICHTILDWKLVVIEKLSCGGLLIIDDTSERCVYILEKSGAIAWLNMRGNQISRIENSLKNFLRRLMPDTEGDLSYVGYEEEISVSKWEKYGMVKFSDEFIRDSDGKNGCNENRIFEKILGVAQKYQKMNSRENRETLVEQLAQHLHFRLMLD